MERLAPATAICLVLLAGSLACERSAGNETQTARREVCIMTPLEHPSLGAAISGFQSAIRETFSAEQISISTFSAGGDPEMVTQRLRETVSRGCDLVFVVTTDASQKARTEVARRGIPVVYTAVTDPVGAGIVRSMDGDTLPITGVSDKFPVPQQVELYVNLVPNARRAALLFNPNEQNSAVLVAQTATELEKHNLVPVRYPTTDAEQIAATSRRAVADADMLIVNGDNLYTENLATVLAIAEQSGKPVLVGDPESVRQGALATVGPDYSALGRQAGSKAIRILQGTKAGEIPSEHPQQFNYYFNYAAAEKLSLQIPAQVLRRAAIWQGGR